MKVWKLFAGIALGYAAWSYLQPTNVPILSTTRRIAAYLDEAAHRSKVRFMDRQHEIYGARQPR